MHVFICSPVSFENIEKKVVLFSRFDTQWYPEISHHWQNTKIPVPCILVGLKSDLRTDAEAIKELAKKNIEPISAAAGMEMAKRINAACYMECSAKTQNGLKEVFDEAIKVALNNKSASSSTEKKGCGCCIM